MYVYWDVVQQINSQRKMRIRLAESSAEWPSEPLPYWVGVAWCIPGRRRHVPVAQFGPLSRTISWAIVFLKEKSQLHKIRPFPPSLHFFSFLSFSSLPYVSFFFPSFLCSFLSSPARPFLFLPFHFPPFPVPFLSQNPTRRSGERC